MNNAYALEKGKPREQAQRSAAIHTTLPLDELIELFENELRDVIPYDSFEYTGAPTGAHVFHGTQRLHKCHYRLNVAHMDLGQITLTRRSAFNPAELQRMETALAALIMHLSNAVSYQKELSKAALEALQADAAWQASRN